MFRTFLNSFSYYPTSPASSNFNSSPQCPTLLHENLLQQQLPFCNQLLIKNPISQQFHDNNINTSGHNFLSICNLNGIHSDSKGRGLCNNGNINFHLQQHQRGWWRRGHQRWQKKDNRNTHFLTNNISLKQKIHGRRYRKHWLKVNRRTKNIYHHIYRRR